MALDKSPLGPMTATDDSDFLSGRAPPSFFRSVLPCAAPARAVAACSSLQIADSGISCSGPVGSKCPSLMRTENRCCSAVSTSVSVMTPIRSADDTVCTKQQAKLLSSTRDACNPENSGREARSRSEVEKRGRSPARRGQCRSRRRNQRPALRAACRARLPPASPSSCGTDTTAGSRRSPS